MKMLIFLMISAVLGYLISGLYDPAKVKTDSRVKVVLFAVIGFVIVILIAGSLVDKNKDYYDVGLTYFKNRNYREAKKNFLLIGAEYEKYDSIQLLIKNSDSLQIVKDSIERAEGERKRIERDKEEITEFKEQIERELISDAFTKGFNKETYRGDLQSLQMELIVFGAWKIIIAKAEFHSDKGINRLGKKLRAKVEACQQKEFPVLRREYARFAKKVLWEDNIEVSIGGNGNRTLELVGGLFASNRNIKQTQETLGEQFKMFRFKRINYKWSEYDDEYTYYSLETPSDKELYTPL
jgi:hypothetical protein